MELGLVWGYWTAQPPQGFVELTQAAENAGFDSVWTAESWGSDAFTPLTWLAAHTSKIRLGTSVVQLSARTPTATAMMAMTLDHLSNGRVVLGLGVSGPQVVEGWYGRPSNKPLARTREYVEIIRQALRREGPLDVRRRVLPAALPRPRRHRARQAAEDHDPPAALGDPDLPRRRGPEERGPDRRDRRRLVPALLLAVPAGGVRGPARPPQGGLRDQPDRHLQRHRRHRAGAVAGEGHARLLHRWHGRQGPELPHQAHGPDGLRGRGRTASRTSSSRASATRPSPPSPTSSPTRSPWWARPVASRSGSRSGARARSPPC